MPKRPSKTKDTKAADKAGANAAQFTDDPKTRERQRQLATRATLGKFRGRKSI